MLAEEVTKERSFLGEPIVRLLVLVLLFIAALCLRLYGIGQPPMDFHVIRQYHGALLARGFYEWLLSGQLKTMPPDGIIEPPILELMASLSYLLMGGEHLWVPRLLSALFWMVGGVFLYLIAKRIVSPNAALFSVFFYLFVPFSIFASRAFMPDPLMVMLLVISVFTIVRYHEEPQSTRRLVVAAVVSSLAVFVKPGICVFQVMGAFVSLSIYREGLRRSLLSSPRLLLFGALTVLPTALYYLYGSFVAGFFQRHTQQKIQPELLLEGFYWVGWLEEIRTVVGYSALIGALLGVLLLRAGLPRALLAGLWGGYFLYGMVFTFHIHTHDYYSLQLIPVVALSLGSVCDSAIGYLWQVDSPYYRRATILGLLALAVVVSAVEHRKTILDTAQKFQGENLQTKSGKQVFTADYEERVKIYEKIGELVHHSRHTIFSAPDFGYPLIYHGRLDGHYWPKPNMWHWWQSRGRSPVVFGPIRHGRRAHVDALLTKGPPEYFIIIKDFGDEPKANWEEDKLLRKVTDNSPVVAEGDEYVVFDLRDVQFKNRD